MYVCLCNALTEKDIKTLISKEGCRRLSALQKNCAAGNNCGACVLQLKQMLNQCERESAAANSELTEKPTKKLA